MKKLDTNFAYAILAVITVGFLLWHSIAIFNLEEDLKNIQNNNIVIPAEAGTQENTQDAHILYNEDGSIDTSNWKTYTNEEYGFSVKYPEGYNYFVESSNNKAEVLFQKNALYEDDYKFTTPLGVIIGVTTGETDLYGGVCKKSFKSNLVDIENLEACTYYHAGFIGEFYKFKLSGERYFLRTKYTIHENVDEKYHTDNPVIEKTILQSFQLIK